MLRTKTVNWEIENKLHWVLNVTFAEDDSRIRTGHGAEVMNALRKIALNIIKQHKGKKLSMARKLKKAALEDDFREECFGVLFKCVCPVVSVLSIALLYSLAFTPD